MATTYTNSCNFPEAIFRAITEDTKSTAGRFSVTQLLSPPRIRRLLDLHDVQVDVVERLWAILGKSMHALLERYAAGAETQLVAVLDGELISGTIDSTDGNVLRDWKMTSVFTGTSGREEWAAQLNCYAWLQRHAKWFVDGAKLRTIENRIEPKELVATMIYRDWSMARAQAANDGSSYPPSPVFSVILPMWEDAEVERFMLDRLNLHRAALETSLPPLCTDEERWHRPGSWAVMKAGRKSAVRVFPTQADALFFAENSAPVKGPKSSLTIEHRIGTDVRCESYCPVRGVCPHGMALQDTKSSSQDSNQSEE
jgi:hypothetical protein